MGQVLKIFRGFLNSKNRMSLSHTNTVKILEDTQPGSAKLENTKVASAGFLILEDLCRDLCGKELIDVPYIDIGDTQRDYIDYVNRIEGQRYPLARSVDFHGRPCLIIRVRDGGVPSNLVVFRRYTDSDTFCQAGSTLPTDMIVSDGRNRTRTFEGLRELIMTGRKEYPSVSKTWTHG